MPSATPLASVDHGRWFVDALSGELTVDGLVPAVFEDFVRLLHPAEADDGRLVRWAEVAAEQGTTLHAAAQFPYLARRRNAGSGRGWRGTDPWEGSLDLRTLETLAGVLAGHTDTPDTVWLNLWDGWGGLPDAWAARPRLDQEGGYRRYFAFRCALDEVAASAVRFDRIGWENADTAGTVSVSAEYTGDDPVDEPQDAGGLDLSLQSPQQWWPDDRSWAVATEIDDDSTIVAGSAALADALLAHPELEVLRIGPHDSLVDTVNPEPPH